LCNPTVGYGITRSFLGLVQNPESKDWVMRMEILITYESDGEEVTVNFPSRNEVCDRCNGYGTHLCPGMEHHAYSYEEFNNEFDPEEQEEYFKRGGMYDVACEVCKGKNVVQVIDEEQCKSEEMKEHLRLYKEWKKEMTQLNKIENDERRMELGYY
jgi:hypothetical protein